jgi:hypothetical protein
MFHSEVLHLIIAIISCYVFLVFALWWSTCENNPDRLYKVTCLLMLGISMTHFGAWWMYRVSENGKTIPEMLEWYWPFRQYFMLVPLLLYASHVTEKLFRKE